MRPHVCFHPSVPISSKAPFYDPTDRGEECDRITSKGRAVYPTLWLAEALAALLAVPHPGCRGRVADPEPRVPKADLCGKLLAFRAALGGKLPLILAIIPKSLRFFGSQSSPSQKDGWTGAYPGRLGSCGQERRSRIKSLQFLATSCS